MKKIRVSFEDFQSSLDAGKNAPFLLSLSEQTDNELRLVLCGSKTGEAEKRKKIPPQKAAGAACRLSAHSSGYSESVGSYYRPLHSVSGEK